MATKFYIKLDVSVFKSESRYSVHEEPYRHETIELDVTHIYGIIEFVSKNAGTLVVDMIDDIIDEEEKAKINAEKESEE